MTTISAVHLEATDPAVAEAFYTEAFGSDQRVRLRGSRHEGPAIVLQHQATLRGSAITEPTA